MLAGYLTLRGAVQVIVDLSQASIRLENALVGLSSVARAFKISQDAAKGSAIALAQDGLMTVTDAARGLKNLLATGFSLPQAIDLMNAFRDSAAFNRQGMLGFGEAVARATEGVRLGMSTLSDAAGVTKNLSQILKEAGFQADDLSRVTNDVNVRMALYRGILKEVIPFTGDAQRLTDQFSGALSKVKTEIELSAAALGKLVNNELKQYVDFINKHLPGLRKWLEEQARQKTGMDLLREAHAKYVVELEHVNEELAAIEKKYKTFGLLGKIVSLVDPIEIAHIERLKTRQEELTRDVQMYGETIDSLHEKQAADIRDKKQLAALYPELFRESVKSADAQVKDQEKIKQAAEAVQAKLRSTMADRVQADIQEIDKLTAKYILAGGRDLQVIEDAEAAKRNIQQRMADAHGADVVKAQAEELRVYERTADQEIKLWMDQLGAREDALERIVQVTTALERKRLAQATAVGKQEIAEAEKTGGSVEAVRRRLAATLTTIEQDTAETILQAQKRLSDEITKKLKDRHDDWIDRETDLLANVNKLWEDHNKSQLDQQVKAIDRRIAEEGRAMTGPEILALLAERTQLLEEQATREIDLLEIKLRATITGEEELTTLLVKLAEVRAGKVAAVQLDSAREQREIVEREFFDAGLKKGMQDFLNEFPKEGERAAQLVADMGHAMQRSLSDSFFAVMQRDFEDLTDAAENFLGGFQRVIADFLSAQVTQQLFKTLQGQFPSVFGAPTGTPAPTAGTTAQFGIAPEDIAPKQTFNIQSAIFSALPVAMMGAGAVAGIAGGTSGGVATGAGTLGGMAAGAAIGTFLLPGLGTMAGAALGGLFGGTVGGLFGGGGDDTATKKTEEIERYKAEAATFLQAFHALNEGLQAEADAFIATLAPVGAGLASVASNQTVQMMETVARLNEQQAFDMQDWEEGQQALGQAIIDANLMIFEEAAAVFTAIEAAANQARESAEALLPATERLAHAQANVAALNAQIAAQAPTPGLLQFPPDSSITHPTTGEAIGEMPFSAQEETIMALIPLYEELTAQTLALADMQVQYLASLQATYDALTTLNEELMQSATLLRAEADGTAETLAHWQGEWDRLVAEIENTDPITEAEHLLELFAEAEQVANALRMAEITLLEEQRQQALALNSAIETLTQTWEQMLTSQMTAAEQAEFMQQQVNKLDEAFRKAAAAGDVEAMVAIAGELNQALMAQFQAYMAAIDETEAHITALEQAIETADDAIRDISRSSLGAAERAALLTEDINEMTAAFGDADLEDQIQMAGDLVTLIQERYELETQAIKEIDQAVESLTATMKGITQQVNQFALLGLSASDQALALTGQIAGMMAQMGGLELEDQLALAQEIAAAIQQRYDAEAQAAQEAMEERVDEAEQLLADLELMTGAQRTLDDVMREYNLLLLTPPERIAQFSQEIEGLTDELLAGNASIERQAELVVEITDLTRQRYEEERAHIEGIRAQIEEATATIEGLEREIDALHETAAAFNKSIRQQIDAYELAALSEEDRAARLRGQVDELLGQLTGMTAGGGPLEAGPAQELLRDTQAKLTDLITLTAQMIATAEEGAREGTAALSLAELETLRGQAIVGLEGLIALTADMQQTGLFSADSLQAIKDSAISMIGQLELVASTEADLRAGLTETTTGVQGLFGKFDAMLNVIAMDATLRDLYVALETQRNEAAGHFTDLTEPTVAGLEELQALRAGAIADLESLIGLNDQIAAVLEAQLQAEIDAQQTIITALQDELELMYGTRDTDQALRVIQQQALDTLAAIKPAVDAQVAKLDALVASNTLIKDNAIDSVAVEEQLNATLLGFQTEAITALNALNTDLNALIEAQFDELEEHFGTRDIDTALKAVETAAVTALTALQTVLQGLIDKEFFDLMTLLGVTEADLTETGDIHKKLEEVRKWFVESYEPYFNGPEGIITILKTKLDAIMGGPDEGLDGINDAMDINNRFNERIRDAGRDAADRLADLADLAAGDGIKIAEEAWNVSGVTIAMSEDFETAMQNVMNAAAASMETYASALEDLVQTQTDIAKLVTGEVPISVEGSMVGWLVNGLPVSTENPLPVLVTNPAGAPSGTAFPAGIVHSTEGTPYGLVYRDAEGNIIAPTSAEAGRRAGGTPLPGFQHGLWDVPASGLSAHLHAGEMVVPAGPAEAMRQGAGQGSVIIQFNMQGAILPDRASLEAWAEQHLAPILRTLSRRGVTMVFDTGIDRVTRGAA